MNRSIAIAMAAIAFLSCLSARAGIISCDLTALGGNQYRCDYTVTNDGAFTDEIRLFDIIFDPALYDEASLLSVSEAGIEQDWSPIFLASGIGIPAAFDAFAAGNGIGVGSSLGGFAVQFSWLGVGLPGAQSFEIYDADTFALLGGGTTLLRPVTTVPEPASLGLLAAGIALLGAMRRRAIGGRVQTAPCGGV